jgi:protein SCO1/2
MHISRALLVALIFAPSLARAGSGSDPSDYVPETPATYKGNGVTVEEHLGAHVPLDAVFTTSDGKPVTLGSVLSGDMPTILTFNYSNCPMLCSLQLNGLSAVMPKLAEPAQMDGKAAVFVLGAQYRVVTIDLEPTETLATLAKMKARYIDRMPEAHRDTDRAGWTFLSGDEETIRGVADAIGFKYVYLKDRAEWAHPAALIFLSSRGAVTRYVYGIQYDVQVMRESIFKAGKAESATAVGFLNRCYHYDPDANSRAHAGVVALRVGAAGFIVLLGAALGLAHWLRKRRRNGVPT